MLKLNFRLGKLFGAVIFCFFLSLNLMAQEQANSTNFKKTCVGCHKDNFEKWDAAVIKHNPYKYEKCESCHANEHKKFTAELDKPCLICHDTSSGKIKKVHFSADLSGVNCVSCHYAHASDRKGLLKEFVNMPFIEGRCDNCHMLNSAGKIELRSEQKKICVVCHSDLVTKEDTVKHAGYEMAECTQCHNPHTSSRKYLLNKSISEICFDCHDKAQAEKHPYDVIPSGKTHVKPSALYNDKITCASCHKSHAAKIPFLLKDSLEQGKLCKDCHKND